MTIKDLLDTPIEDMWSAAFPLILGYFSVVALMFILCVVLFVFIFIYFIKVQNNFKNIKKRNQDRRNQK